MKNCPLAFTLIPLTVFFLIAILKQTIETEIKNNRKLKELAVEKAEWQLNAKTIQAIEKELG